MAELGDTLATHARQAAHHGPLWHATTHTVFYTNHADAARPSPSSSPRSSQHANSRKRAHDAEADDHTIAQVGPYASGVHGYSAHVPSAVVELDGLSRYRPTLEGQMRMLVSAMRGLRACAWPGGLEDPYVITFDKCKWAPVRSPR